MDVATALAGAHVTLGDMAGVAVGFAAVVAVPWLGVCLRWAWRHRLGF